MRRSLFGLICLVHWSIDVRSHEDRACLMPTSSWPRRPWGCGINQARCWGGGDTCSDPVLSGVKMDQHQGSAQIVLPFSHNCSVTFWSSPPPVVPHEKKLLSWPRGRDALVPFQNHRVGTFLVDHILSCVDSKLGISP